MSDPTKRTALRGFFRWLFCPCRPTDRQHEDGPWQDWGVSECTRCGRRWMHFRDAAWRIPSAS